MVLVVDSKAVQVDNKQVWVEVVEGDHKAGPGVAYNTATWGQSEEPSQE